MDLYFAASGEVALEAPGESRRALFICSDWLTRQALREHGRETCLLNEAFSMDEGMALESFCLDLAGRWHLSAEREDITVFRGISLGKVYEGFFWYSVLTPFYRFQEAARLFIDRDRPARIRADGGLAPFKLALLQALAGDIPVEVRGAAAPADLAEGLPGGTSLRDIVWPLDRWGGIRMAYNLIQDLRSWAPGAPRRRRWILSHYPSLFPLYREIFTRAPEVEISFFGWPGKNLAKLRDIPNLRLVTARSGGDESPEAAAWAQRLEDRWESMRREETYRRRFAFRAPIVWAVMENALKAFFLKDVRILMRQLVILQSALDREPPELIAVPYTRPPPERMLVAEGRRRGIPTVTLLHGLPGRYRHLDNLQTEYVLVGGEAQIPLFEAVGAQPGHVLATGMPQLDPYFSALPPARPADGKPLPHILVLAQATGVNTSMTAEEDVPETYLLNVIAALDGIPDIRITLRPHPSAPVTYLKKVLEGRLDARYSFDTSSRFAELLAASDLVIGHFSTTALEAFALRKPFLLVNFSRCAYPPPFAPDSQVPTIASREDLAAAVRGYLRGAEVGSCGCGEILRSYGGASDGKNVLRVVGALQRIASSNGYA